MNRVREGRADNVKAAIRCFEASLEFRTRQALPFFWAMTQMNLGSAYLQRGYGDTSDDAARARTFRPGRASPYTRDVFAIDWASVQLGLGHAYSDVPNSDRAIACYEAALDVYSREGHPERWAFGHHNIGLCYSRLAANGLPRNRKHAVHHYRQALEVLTPEVNPVRCIKHACQPR